MTLITEDSSQTPTALTIAGSDSSGGAGIQADLKTFAAHGVFGMSAITAVTAQNTLGVTAVETFSPEFVTAQIDAVVQDIRPRATKIGMLANAGIVRAVAETIARHELPLVVLDTVMVAKSGARLLAPEAIDAMVRELFPLATIVTPNLLEIEALTGRRVTSVTEFPRAAEALIGLGARAVLIKGGHLPGSAEDVVDTLYNGQNAIEFRRRRLPTRHTHGTGCTLSAAIAARLARGHDLSDAVRLAKDYVTRAIAQAPGLGHGHGPLQHFPKPTDLY